MLTGVLFSSVVRSGGPDRVFREMYSADPSLHLALLLIFSNYRPLQTGLFHGLIAYEQYVE